MDALTGRTAGGAPEYERLAETFQQAPSFMCVLAGADHIIERANDRFFELVGARDIVGRPVRVAFPEVAGQGYFELLDEVYRSGEPFVGSGLSVQLQRLAAHPVETRSVDCACTALRDASGAVTGVLVQGVDHTERWRAETALRESEERFRQIAENLNAVFYVADVPGRRLRYVSAACERSWGLRADELLSSPHAWLDLVHRDDRAGVDAAFAMFVDGSTPFDVEYRVVLPNGETRWVRDRATIAARDADGRTTRVTGIADDITERIRVREQIASLNDDLSRRVEELETLLRIIPVGIFVAQDASCRTISMNPAGAAMLRVPEDVNASKTGPEGPSLPFRILRDGVEVPDDDLPMQRAARDGTSIAGEELDIVFADGTSINLHEYATPLFDEAGRVRGCLGVFVDLTERKRVEEALKEADRRKDEFLATLAHELRNPLAPIRNGLSVLRLAGHGRGVAGRVHDVIERQVDHLVRLVDDLMEVSRITRGKIELRMERVALSAIVHNAVETSRPLVEAGGHVLEIDLGDEALPVEADPVRLAQVLANLLNNAAKYTEPGGRIVLEARRDGDAVRVSVRDNGVGIPGDMLAGVFDLFTQVDRTYGRAQGGLGIGLTLVRSLVQMHGGTVEARSEGVGRGSEFILRLPSAAGAPPVAPAEAERAGPAVLPCRIVVVDDNRDAAESLAMLLGLFGADVHVAHDGEAALETCARTRPSIVLLDLGMPGMDGYEVARRLRQRQEGDADLTLIALTGWGQAEDRRRSQDAGIDHHLVKPVDSGVLQALLATLPRRPASGRA